MQASSTNDYSDRGADGGTVAVGHLPVHAMRFPASSAWYAHLEGQVIEHGQLVK